MTDELSLAAFSAEKRYQLLVDAITDFAIYMLDLDGNVSSWNPGAQRFKGYTEAEIIGQHFSRFYTPEDRERGLPQRALETAAREGRFESEGWRVRKDGSRFWTQVVIDPIFHPGGGLIGYAKITRDLTDKKIAEDALRESERQFRTLVQSVTDYAIYMLTPEGKVASWNAGAEHIKGYTPDEIIGSHFSRFYTPDDAALGLPAIGLATAAERGRFSTEGWRVRKDGTEFWASVVIDAIRDEAGNIAGYAKITRDISERRDAEIALNEAREALFQAQKLEAIGQLTGGVAHDFNNLLAVVLTNLELLRKRLPADPSLLPLIDNSLASARRGVTLTQRMLSFARRQELEPRPTALPALLEGLAPILQQSVGAGIDIEFHFPPNLPSVTVDPHQLETGLLNLAVNSRDAMPDGGLITISGRRESVTQNNQIGLEAGDYAALSITDNGNGMDAETLRRAIEPFFTTKGVGKGTGLGLSMVQGLCEQSGGKLEVRSSIGVGTTVVLWLPESNARPAAPEEDTPPPPPPAAERRPLTVLAVDDDALVLMGTSALLEDLGHTAIEALSAAEALEVLHSGQTVDLVLTDQAMPQMTGAQLAETIAEEWPGLPVAIATGYAQLPPGVALKLPKLSKPFSQTELESLIETLLYK